MDCRFDRISNYLKSIDWRMDKYPDLIHRACVNPQGSGKDLVINSDIFEMYRSDKSIFDDVIVYILNRPYYQGHIDNIYSNATLNPVLYGDDYYRIVSKKDITDAENGVIYLHDAERYFNSVGLSMEKPDAETIKVINNTRKSGNFLELSLHRFKSLHVRIRELIPLWIKPNMFFVGDNPRKMIDYEIVFKMIDGNGNSLFNGCLGDLPLYAGLYDTLEKAMPFSQGDL